MLKMNIVLLLLFFTTIPCANGANQSIPPEDMQPASMSRVCDKVDCVDSLSKFKRLKEVQPSASPIPLKNRTDLGFFEKAFVSRANAIFDRNPAVAMILIDKGEIIHERYHPEVNGKTPLLSYSLSKSLTSMVVGKALCEGDLKSLDVKSKEVNPILDGTAYGEASIKQILMMASGSIRGSALNGGSPNGSGFGNPNNLAIYSSIINQLRKFKDFQSKLDGTFVKPGEEFSYKNLDTQSLAFLFPVSGERTFLKIFEKDIWQAAGAENKGYWVHDKDGYIHTASGFNGSPRDWARVSLKILQAVSLKQSDCFADFMKEATTTQIKNTGDSMPEDNWIGRGFKGYGYQFWTQNTNDNDVIYLNGAYGQRIAISPKKQRIMLVFSYNEIYMDELYKLFASW